MSVPRTSAETPAVAETESGQRQARVQRQHRRVTPGRVVVTVLRYIALIISAVLFLLPFYLIVRNALSKDTTSRLPAGRSSRSNCTGRTSASCSPIQV
jgi:hypothetical protein